MIPNDFNSLQLKTIGERLREKRQARGEKMDTVAKAIGRSKKVLSQVENGLYHALKVELLIEMLAYLDMKWEELL